jgi:glycosyltransferase involved in cell wall biosynthesis
MRDAERPDGLDIVVPVYNEGANIARLLEAVERDIASPKRLWCVYDSDDDDTLPVLAEASGSLTFPVTALKNAYGSGALGAIRTGLDHAPGEAVLVTMADLSDTLTSADAMYALVRQGCAVAAGSRYMKGGCQTGGPWIKGLMSRCAGVSLHVLTGLPTHDVTNSFKCYRTDMLREIEIESSGGFEIGMEITVKAYLEGWPVGEVPAGWEDRAAGESRFQLMAWLPRYLHWYWECVRRAGWRGRKLRQRVRETA